MLRIGVPIAVFWLVVDQVTKWWILDHVMDPPRVIPITGFFNIVLGHNTGVSFGLFGGAPAWSLVVVSSAVVVVLLIWMTRVDDRLSTIALGLVAGGGTGNLLDRLRHGGVTDFLDFYVGQWHWPAFNMADVGIVCGVGILLLVAILPVGSTESSEA